MTALVHAANSFKLLILTKEKNSKSQLFFSMTISVFGWAHSLDQTIAFMSEHGFIHYEFVDFLRRPLDGAMGQCDILFVRSGHPLVSDRRWIAV